MALATSGALSMSAIHVEAEGSPYAHSGIVSLNDTNVRGLTPASGYSINSTAGTTSSIGDFYGASLITTLLSGTMTNGFVQGSQYVPSFSGYVSALSTGSWSGTGNFTYDGDTVSMVDLRNFDGAIWITFTRTNGNNGTFNNSGWTSLKIYLNQTNNSGSADLTLTRSSATFTTASNSPSAFWYWGTTNTYSLSSYFGTTSGNQHFIEVI